MGRGILGAVLGIVGHRRGEVVLGATAVFVSAMLAVISALLNAPGA